MASQLRVALTLHLLIHAAAQREAVPHWRGEARAALVNAGDAFAPSMAQRIDLDRQWQAARAAAADKLAGLGGATQPLPAECPYALAEVVAPDPDLDALLAGLAAA